MNTIGNDYIILLVMICFVFSMLIFRKIYKKHIGGFKPGDNKIIYSDDNLNLKKLNKISTRPFLFGLEKKIISNYEFYFDDNNFYAINPKTTKKAVFLLTDITELGTTSIQINNRRIWQVKINQTNGKEIIFRFAHNYTIWNNNFCLFYEKVKTINPAAIKAKWNLWTM